MSDPTAPASLTTPRKEDGAGAVQFVGARKSYGTLEVLKGIDLTIPKGERLVLIGPSGCGKSTLLRCVNGLESLSGGQLLVHGVAIPQRERDLIGLRRQVGMVFQQFSLFPHLTVFGNLELAPRRVAQMAPAEIRDRARLLLDTVGLADKIDSYPSELSGGQQQRVAIARALMLQPKIMLFDEVTSALDPELVGEVLQVMHKLAETGMTLIVVTHEMSFARDLASRVIFMDAGTVVEDAEPNDIFGAPKTERLQRFLKRFG